MRVSKITKGIFGSALLLAATSAVFADVVEEPPVVVEEIPQVDVVHTAKITQEADSAPVAALEPVVVIAKPNLSDLTFLHELTTAEALNAVSDEELEQKVNILDDVLRKLNGTLNSRLESKAASSSALLALFNTLILSVGLCVAVFFGFNSTIFLTEKPAKPPTLFSVIMPDSEEPGWGPVRRHYRSPDKLLAIPTDGTSTLYEAFQLGLKNNSTGPCFGYRPQTIVDGKPKGGDYKWLSYQEVNERANNFGSGLVTLGLIPNIEGLKMIAIYMKNNIEWVIAENACYKYNACTVPLYDTLGPDTVVYVLNQTKVETVLCSAKEVKVLLESKASAHSLKTIIQTGNPSKEDKDAAANAGVKLLSYAEVEENGKANPQKHTPPVAEDVATFCYTSGTTGDPKGAILTHQNLIANLVALENCGIIVTSNDIHLSYLPLAHVFERLIVGMVMWKGGRIGFFQGDTRLLMDDLKTLRPTVFPSVPRLLNRVYDGVMAKTQGGGLKTKLFNLALATKKANLKKGYLKHPIWDPLIFNKIKHAAGLDRCHIIVSGSAPLSPDVMEFLRAVLGCVVLEGYGQTETGGCATVGDPADYSVGHVGIPQCANEIRLQDVPEMGYTSKDTVHGENVRCAGRGEICFRGYNVFKEYYKMPEKTAEAIDAEGWCHSGDIGIWLPDGRLKIVDRKKNIFKLAQGEYIAAEKIENIYAVSQFVAQAFVYGDSFQHFLVAIFHPDEHFMMKWAAENNISGDLKAVCASEEARKAVLADVIKIGKERKLHGFEQIKDCFLSAEAFSPENGILTPSFKLKRHEAKIFYKDQINDLYVKNGGQQIQL